MSPPLQPSITLLPPTNRNVIGAALNERLADTTALLGMVQSAHWNVRGEHAFLPAHRLFGKLAKGLWKTMEALAGRLRCLGVYALGTLVPPPIPRIPVYPPDLLSVEDHLREVSMRLAVLIHLLRGTRDLASKQGDEETADRLTELLIKFESKGRRLLNSQTDAEGTKAMNAAVAALGASQFAAGARTQASAAPKKP